MTVEDREARGIASTITLSLKLSSLVLAAQLLTACAARPPAEPSQTTPTDGSRAQSEWVPPGGRAKTDALRDETILLQSAAYEVIYSETKRNPLVVSYYLRPQSKGDQPCARPSRFLRDDRTRSRVKERAFQNTGYDKGHLAPNAPIGKRYGCEPQRETFLLSNIAPQLPGLNQRTWASFEAVADTVYANDFNGVWVMTGPIFDPAQIVTLCGTPVEVPSAFWKIVVRRVGEGIDTVALIMSQQERSAKPIGAFITTIDDIEARTGINFFAGLPKAEEQAVESRCASEAWRLQRPLVAPNEGWGAPRPICTTAAVSRREPLGTRLGTSLTCTH